MAHHSRPALGRPLPQLWWHGPVSSPSVHAIRSARGDPDPR